MIEIDIEDRIMIRPVIHHLIIVVIIIVIGIEIVIHLVVHVVLIQCHHVMINLPIIIVLHFKVISLNHLHPTMKLDHLIVQVEIIKIRIVRHKTQLHHLHHLLLLHHYLLLHPHHHYQDLRFSNQCIYSTMICICNKLLGFLHLNHRRRQIPFLRTAILIELLFLLVTMRNHPNNDLLFFRFFHLVLFLCLTHVRFGFFLDVILFS
jgi:hypothetical protein